MEEIGRKLRGPNKLFLQRATARAIRAALSQGLRVKAITANGDVLIQQPDEAVMHPDTQFMRKLT